MWQWTAHYYVVIFHTNLTNAFDYKFEFVISEWLFTILSLDGENTLAGKLNRLRKTLK